MLNLFMAVFIGSADADAEFLVGPFAGLVIGEFAVPVVWGVLGPQRLVTRLAVSLGIVAWLLGTFFLGVLTAEMPPPGPREVAVGVLMLPMLFLAAQLPVWILRAVMGCRLVVGVEGQAQAPKDARQFRVADLLLTTAVVALCLGLAQWGIRLTGIPMDAGRDAMILGTLAARCGVIAFCSAVVLLPGIWAVLIVGNKALGALVYVGLAVAAWLVIVVIGTIVSRGYVPPEVVVTLFLFFAVLAGTVLGSLHILRISGLTLVWPRRKRLAEPAGEPMSPFVSAKGKPAPAKEASREEESTGRGGGQRSQARGRK